MNHKISIVLLLLSLGIGCGVEDKSIEVVPGTPRDFVTDKTATERLKATDGKEDVDFSHLETARKLAIEILKLASSKSSGQAKEVFDSVAKALEHVHFDYPEPGHDLQQCARERDVLAFVITYDPSQIHFCRRALQPFGQKKLAQILIHETSHVIGVTDECEATRIEVAAMRATRGLAFKNGYWDRCRIR